MHMPTLFLLHDEVNVLKFENVFRSQIDKVVQLFKNPFLPKTSNVVSMARKCKEILSPFSRREIT